METSLTNVRGDKRTIALAKLPVLIRSALRDFRTLTGFTAVSTLGFMPPDGRMRGQALPPLHPLCKKLLRRDLRATPCEAEWRKHLRSAERTGGSRIHICPLGLRCAGIPIALDDELLGLAKLVCGPQTAEERFRSVVHLLEVLITRPCRELHVLLLREELHALQASVERLQRVKRPAWYRGTDMELSRAGTQSNHSHATAHTLVGQVLDYLNQHYTESQLSLAHVSHAVGKNEKYVAHVFVQEVGERMRTHIARLRVRRACELLLQTDRTIAEIALDSGFARPGQFRQSFHRLIGVAASEYRQIFGTAG